MESRKMVLENLLTERNRHREQTCGHGEMGERVRYMERVTWKLTLLYVKQIANRNLLYGLETQTGALYQPGGMGWGGRWEGIYVYLWLIQRFDRKQQNSVKQLSFNKKNKLKKKKS